MTLGLHWSWWRADGWNVLEWLRSKWRVVRYCPRCATNQRFVGRVRPMRVLADAFFGFLLEDDTGIGWRKLRCATCGLPAKKAARTALPT